MYKCNGREKKIDTGTPSLSHVVAQQAFATIKPSSKHVKSSKKKRTDKKLLLVET